MRPRARRTGRYGGALPPGGCRHLACAVVLAMAVAACADPPPQVAERTATADYSTPIVLFVNPDSQEIERLRQEMGEDFYIATDDWMWYRAAAHRLLDSLGVPSTEVGKGAATFLVDGRSRRVSWERVDLSWFVFVYDGKTTPRISADVDLPEELDGLLPGPVP